MDHACSYLSLPDQIRLVALHQETHVRSSHFFPTLISIVDPLTRIRVVPVIGRIVVAEFNMDPGTLGYLQRCSISQLPIEVVAGDIENDSSRPSGYISLYCTLFARMCACGRNQTSSRSFKKVISAGGAT